MVALTEITYVTADVTVSDLNSVYLVDAAKGNITITLPRITCDGMNYEFTRKDISKNTITLVATPPNTIYQNTSVAGTVLLMNSINMQSYQDNWYTTFDTYPNNVLNNRPLFSTAFVTSNSSTFITAVGGARTAVCQFNCLGPGYANLSLLDTVLANTYDEVVTGTIDLRDFNSQKVYGKADFSLDPATKPLTGVTVYITSFDALPAEGTILEYGITVSGMRTIKVNVYSLILR